MTFGQRVVAAACRKQKIGMNPLAWKATLNTGRKSHRLSDTCSPRHDFTRSITRVVQKARPGSVPDEVTERYSVQPDSTSQDLLLLGEKSLYGSGEHNLGPTRRLIL